MEVRFILYLSFLYSSNTLSDSLTVSLSLSSYLPLLLLEDLITLFLNYAGYEKLTSKFFFSC